VAKPDLLIEAELNIAIAPVGRTLALNAIVLENLRTLIDCLIGNPSYFQ
jgi:hypothetical protein